MINLPAFNRNILAIIGPTGIGKSDFSIRLAREWGCEVVSADAFQVYRGMDIGTAKISIDLRNEIPHHCIDIRNPDETYSVGEFLAELNPLIADATLQNKRLIICGGTGLYIHSLLHQFQLPVGAENPELRADLYSKLERNGGDLLWAQLDSLDSKAAAQIHPNQTRRVVRALEVVISTGKPLSESRSQSPEPRDDIQVIGLFKNRALLWGTLHSRVDRMIQDGLIDEVSSLLTRYSPDSQAFQALGYKETVAYLDGKIGNHNALSESIYIHTRQFAKRQMTWFKRLTHVHWIEVD